MMSSSTRFLIVTVIAPRVYRSGVTQRRSFDFVQVSCGNASATFPVTFRERDPAHRFSDAEMKTADGFDVRAGENGRHHSVGVLVC